MARKNEAFDLKSDPRIGRKTNTEHVRPRAYANGVSIPNARGLVATRIHLGDGYYAFLPPGKGGTAEDWNLPTFDAGDAPAPPAE